MEPKLGPTEFDILQEFIADMDKHSGDDQGLSQAEREQQEAAIGQMLNLAKKLLQEERAGRLADLTKASCAYNEEDVRLKREIM